MHECRGRHGQTFPVFAVWYPGFGFNFHGRTSIQCRSFFYLQPYAGMAAPVTADAVSLVLVTIDRLKSILAELEATAAEPSGSDDDLIVQLEQMARDRDAPIPANEEITIGALAPQVLERALRPDEVSLDDLERAFRDTPGPEGKPADKREAERRAG